MIILIDEYDVPLAKAYEYGYYDQMVLLIRKLLSYCLKSNTSLQFAVLTGCMRISKENVKEDRSSLDRFCNALERGDAAEVEAGFNAYLKKTISIRDTDSAKNMKENFYPGVLLGILGCRGGDWIPSSNLETGDGYCDIIVRTRDYTTAILIEVKYAEDGNLDAACRKALKQMADRRYGEELEKDYKKVLKYGLACYKKQCKVMMQE